MFNNILKVHDQMFGVGVTMPANTTVTLATALKLGGSGQSALACTITAESAVALGANKAITLQFQESDDNVTFADRIGLITYSYTAAKNWVKGDVVARVLIPGGAKKWLKVKLGTNDATVTGTVDVFAEYLAR